nr:MAG TPA: hypothetical protein [Bacteriophage sp.]
MLLFRQFVDCKYYSLHFFNLFISCLFVGFSL